MCWCPLPCHVLACSLEAPATLPERRGRGFRPLRHCPRDGGGHTGRSGPWSWPLRPPGPGPGVTSRPLPGPLGVACEVRTVSGVPRHPPTPRSSENREPVGSFSADSEIERGSSKAEAPPLRTPAHLHPQQLPGPGAAGDRGAVVTARTAVGGRSERPRGTHVIRQSLSPGGRDSRVQVCGRPRC